MRGGVFKNWLVRRDALVDRIDGQIGCVAAQAAAKHLGEPGRQRSTELRAREKHYLWLPLVEELDQVGKRGHAFCGEDFVPSRVDGC